MPQDTASAEFNTFVSGLITEASPLNFPENASLDEQNFVLNRDGSRQRRLGIDYEVDYSFTDMVISNTSFQEGNNRIDFYRWDNVDNDPTISLGVVRVGRRFWFMDLYTDAPSSNILNSGNYVNFGAMAANSTVSFATFAGKLVVTIGSRTIHLLSYDSDTDVISEESLDISVRDIWGVDDDLDIDEQPNSLSNKHEYNLYNQGWPDYRVDRLGGGSAFPVEWFEDEEGEYPSNADIYHVGLTKDDDGDPAFDPRLVKQGNWFGNTLAPRGHTIIDLFNRGSSRENSSSRVGSLPTDKTNGGFNTVAPYAGRLFYSGIEVSSLEDGDDRSPRLENFVVFSQVAQTVEDLSKCYSEADPTAENINELVDTDGGTISITEASRIFKLVPVGKQLLVIAENGLWSIGGSEEGFSATNFQVSKISNVGALNADSVVVAEGTVFYWSKAGIYTLQPDQITGEYSPVNISEGTIQTLYTDIEAVGRLYCKGIYDEAARKIRWLYNDDDDYNGIQYVNRYNKELVLDLTLQAFYKNSIPSGIASPSVTAYISSPNYNVVNGTEDVEVDGDPVVVNGDSVNIVTPVRSRGTSATKYLVVRPGVSNTEFSVAIYRNASFKDWYTQDNVGTDASAFVETGYFTGGDSQRDKSVKYLTVHCKRTEEGYMLDNNGNIDFDSPSSCLAQARWDFSDHGNSGKWGTQFQAYRLNRLYLPSNVSDPFDYGYDVITTKNKLRGTGKAIRVKFSSEEDKDLYIYGWGMAINQKGDV